MPITTDVRRAVDQGRAVLEDARKPLYAFVGAGDLAVSRTASQLRELPAETQSAVDDRVRLLRARLEELRTDVRTRVAGLRGKANELSGRATELSGKAAADLQDTANRAFITPAELRALVEAYLDRAKVVYEDLAVRGEKVVTTVSKRPGVKNVIGRAEALFDRGEHVVSDATASVSHAADSVSDAAGSVSEATATPRKAPARKTTARRTTAS